MYSNDKQQLILGLMRISPQDSIFDVVGKMEILIGLLESDEKFKNINPFLRTYFFVTKNVAISYYSSKEVFKDFHSMELLDILFAKKFFDPLREYFLSDLKHDPWGGFFDYTETGRNIPFVQMFLGINAHINADLTTTLLDLEYSIEEDFRLINKILLDTIPEVMSELALKQYDLFGMGGLIFKNFFTSEFEKVIVRWRDDAWGNYQKLKSIEDEGIKDRLILDLYKQTEEIANTLRSLFLPKEYLNPLNMLDEINDLRVSI